MRWFAGILIGVAIIAALVLIDLSTMPWNAEKPGRVEEALMKRIKYWRIGGTALSNPVPDTPEGIRMGADHFQHHCQICHGLDGQNSGVPFAEKMSPPAADLASARVQHYKDGQLKWIVEKKWHPLFWHARVERCS